MMHAKTPDICAIFHLLRSVCRQECIGAMISQLSSNFSHPQPLKRIKICANKKALK